MSDAISSFGTLLKLGDGATPTEAFTTIAEVLDISGPALEMDTEESTNHSSPGGWKEHVGTLLSAGDVTFDVNFLPANATHSYSAGLLKDMTTKTKRNFELIFPTSPAITWDFTALVVGFEPDAPVNGILKASVTLRISGQPTLA